jgi:hypothetical protein
VVALTIELKSMGGKGEWNGQRRVWFGINEPKGIGGVLGLGMLTGWVSSLVEAAVKFGVDGAGFGELVFEDDDAARGIECGAVVDEFAGSGRDPQLIARVAAVPAVGSLGGEQLRLVEAA